MVRHRVAFRNPISEGGNMVGKLDKAMYGVAGGVGEDYGWFGLPTSCVHPLFVLSSVVGNSCCGTCG